MTFKPLNPNNMLDNKTKERIAQEANDKAVEYANAGVYHTVLPKGHLMYPSATGHFSDYFKAYIAGAEAEATRAAELKKVLEEVQVLAKRGIFPDLPVEVMGAQMCIDIDKLITEFLTNYNNPVNK